MPSERGGLRADQVLPMYSVSTVGASPAGDSYLSNADAFADVPEICGSWLASDGGLIADQSLADVLSSNCGSEPAREGFLSGGGVLSA